MRLPSLAFSTKPVSKVHNVSKFFDTPVPALLHSVRVERQFEKQVGVTASLPGRREILIRKQSISFLQDAFRSQSRSGQWMRYRLEFCRLSAIRHYNGSASMRVVSIAIDLVALGS